MELTQEEVAMVAPLVGVFNGEIQAAEIGYTSQKYFMKNLNQIQPNEVTPQAPEAQERKDASTWDGLIPDWMTRDGDQYSWCTST
jgi:hypothetical protein